MRYIFTSNTPIEFCVFFRDQLMTGTGYRCNKESPLQIFFAQLITYFFQLCRLGGLGVVPKVLDIVMAVFFLVDGDAS